MFVAEHLVDPIKKADPRRIFVNSMSDVFFEPFTDDQIAAQFAIMAIADQHQYQVLTKRPARMVQWLSLMESCDHVGNALADALMKCLPLGQLEAKGSIGKALRVGVEKLRSTPNGELWPLWNVLLGVSVENQAAANERIPLLVDIHDEWQVFLSCEPLLERVDLTPWLGSSEEHPLIDWVIVGGESGDARSRQLHPDWVRRLRDQCKESGVAFFFKQWGDWHVTPTDAPGCFVTYFERRHKKLNGNTIDGQTHQEYPVWRRRAT